MKSKFLKIAVALLCVSSVICVANFVTVRNVKADSGWDSDYDSGGSDWGSDSDWDSDWSSDSDWDSSDSSSSDGTFFSSLFSLYIFICFIVVFGILIPKLNKNSQNNRVVSNNSMPPKLSLEKIYSVDPDLNVYETNKMVFDTYKEIQNAWMNFDYDSLRKYTTDELYNMYTMQLDTLQVKGQKNIMKDFVLVDSYISNIYKENNIETVDIILTTNFYDYVVDSNNKVVRGSDKFKLEITYKLTFVKTLTQKDNNFCPNCGAKLENNASTVCPYCNSVIVSDNYNWVMSKKQSIHQRRI